MEIIVDIVLKCNALIARFGPLNAPLLLLSLPSVRNFSYLSLMLSRKFGFIIRRIRTDWVYRLAAIKVYIYFSIYGKVRVEKEREKFCLAQGTERFALRMKSTVAYRRRQKRLIAASPSTSEYC
jgi:hypothetical protein